MAYDKDYIEKRNRGLIIDATNIHLFAQRIDVNEIRRERANKCSWCGKFVPDGHHAPGGLCSECNNKADWNDEPGEDYDVGCDFGRTNRDSDFGNNRSSFGFGIEADEEEDPDVGF